MEERSAQLELWESGADAIAQERETEDGAGVHFAPPRRFALQGAVDRIHSRYGARGVQRGIQLAAISAALPRVHRIVTAFRNLG